ncbi:MAG TPA: GAF domain-containing protein, partial [Flavisolibacter sp.]|nr:GAF domain-containing protein [Flavisolibacter sp.]
AIRSIQNATEIEETVTKIGLDYFGSDRCYYCAIEDGMVTVSRDACRGNLPSVSGTYPLHDFVLFKKAIDEGRPLVVNNAAATEVLDEGLRDICLGLHILSFINIPVMKEGKPVGIFCLVQSTVRHWTNTEVELAAETAERIWAAVERAKAEEALRINETRMRGQKEALQAVVNGEPLSNALNLLARIVIDETKGEARTAFFLANADSTRLHPVPGAGNMPDAYLKEMDGFLIGPDSLACGLAVPTGKPVLTADVQKEPLWKPWTFMAEKYDYRGCWSFPIKTRDIKAVGTFAMYFQAPREATAKDMELAGMVTQTAAIIISSHTDIRERARAEASLKQFANQLEEEVIKRTAALRQSGEDLQKNLVLLQQAEELAQMGSWEYNQETEAFHWSEGMYRLFGLP